MNLSDDSLWTLQSSSEEESRTVSQVCRLGRGSEAIYIIPVGYAATEDDGQDAQGPGLPVNGWLLKRHPLDLTPCA